MYSIILVDDEASIRNGMADSIPWKEWGFEVAGLYANGQQALQAIEKNPPDVVLSDICMPKMDGVELMQVLNQRFPQVKIIILSGYSDFEYLNMSIKNNVCEYLLKPTDIDEFELLFKKIKQQLDDEQRQNIERQENRKSRFDEWMNLLLKGFLEDETVALLEDQSDLHFENCHVVLLTPDGRLGDDDKFLYRLKKNIVEQCNKALGGVEGYFFLNYEEIVTGIISLPAEHNLSSSAVEKSLKKLQQVVQRELNATISAGISTLATEAALLPVCYQQAKCCVRQNVFMGNETLFFYAQFENTGGDTTVYFNIDVIKQALLDNNYDALNQELENVFASFDNRALKNYEFVDQLCIDAMFVISRWVLQYNIRFEQIMDSLGSTYTDIYRCDSLFKKHQFMLALFFAVQQQLGQAKPAGGQRSSLAYMVKNCVDESYASNQFSLEYVAERLHKTPAHISKVFKNELGMNFSGYLTKKRMEKSIGLLSDLSLKIYEIADMVGYADTSNFIKVFKKNYGISPNEYRQNAASGNVQ